MFESDSCSCCPNTIESPWHVIGECNDDVAVQARSEWGDRMWEVLRKETTVQSGRTSLRTDVADAMKRLWARDEHGRIPAWTPGSVGPVGGTAPQLRKEYNRGRAEYWLFCGIRGLRSRRNHM